MYNVFTSSPESGKEGGLLPFVFGLAASCGYLGIEVAICTEAPAERYVDVDHGIIGASVQPNRAGSALYMHQLCIYPSHNR